MNWKFTLFAVLVMVSVSAYAVISECSDGSEAASDDSGSCGHNVTYVFDSSTGTLTISGSGDIYSSGGAPWYPYRSDVKKVVIEDGITDIGPYAFRDCIGLRELTLPISISAIGSDYNCPAFYGCTNIEKVTFTPGTGKGYEYAVDYYGRTPCNYSSAALEVVIEDGVTSIGKYTFYGCSSLVSVTIPDSVTSIGSDAFYGCSSLVSVTIPDSVTRINSSVFSGCSSLASVTIPDSVTSIDHRAFYGCSSLTSIILPDSVNPSATMRS